jgi:sentrin-specific protease 1
VLNEVKQKPGQAVVIQKFGISITNEDYLTLDDERWLNDEVVNFYFQMIQQRSKDQQSLPKTIVMPSFFYKRLTISGHSGVKRWTKNYNIFNADFMMLPINVGMVHWCFAAIDFKNKRIEIFDSKHWPLIEELDNLERYLIEEARRHGMELFGWTKQLVNDFPRQTNDNDCGVFMCVGAEHISRSAKLNFSQSEMAVYRLKIITEISHGEFDA